MFLSSSLLARATVAVLLLYPLTMHLMHLTTCGPCLYPCSPAAAAAVSARQMPSLLTVTMGLLLLGHSVPLPLPSGGA